MKKLKVILISSLILGLIGYGVFNYVMHGGARDLSSEKADYTVSSKKIMDEFSTNAEVSNKKYLEKAVAVSGIITDSNPNQVIIDNTIICTLKSPIASLKKNQAVTLKGRVVGYDDLMGEIKLDQCFVN
jgi:tRNA_anti-like